MMKVLLVSVLLAGGVCTGAQPAWHLVKRTVASIVGQQIWQNWQNNDELPDGEFSGLYPAFWLQVPAARIDSLVLSGANKRSLTYFPALTVLPAATAVDGSPIRVVLGHRDTHFRSLGKISQGSEVIVENKSGELERLVVIRRMVVDADNAMASVYDALAARSSAPLVLVTCYPFEFIGPAPQRLIVVAEQVK